VKRLEVTSRAIRSVGYQAGTLEIEFVHGDVYRYFLVPRGVFLELMQAESKARSSTSASATASRPKVRAVGEEPLGSVELAGSAPSER
jgi:KTSC domain